MTTQMVAVFIVGFAMGGAATFAVVCLGMFFKQIGEMAQSRDIVGELATRMTPEEIKNAEADAPENAKENKNASSKKPRRRAATRDKNK